ncbi:MAG TPA: efflux RND transporter periplasmic adaptor subunit [Thermoanaerobaculia bacterium]|nr:efflux RND transporter periplasmic adaptor subunit [Thermoanaerobaculia bacterium]
MKKRFLLMTAALVALAACGGEKARPAASTAPQRPPRPVSTAVVERSGAGEVTVPAVVAARQSATLAARLPAAVRALPKREGETVAAGEVVVRLDDTALRAQVAAAEAGRQVAEVDLNRMQGLAQRGAATPREVEEATARAAAARAQASAARDGLAYAVLRSPFPGVIAARKAEVGDVVSPGQPLVIVEGRGGLELRASVTAEESRGLKPGSEIEARVDGIPNPLRARLTALSPAGDPATHRFELKADLPSTEGLRSGLFARLALPGGTAEEGALTVPAEAVFPRGGLTGVFVADGGTARLRWIAVGAPSGDRVEVRAGLAAGERVVIAPGPLADGDPIAPSDGKEGR